MVSSQFFFGPRQYQHDVDVLGEGGGDRLLLRGPAHDFGEQVVSGSPLSWYW